MFFDTVGLAWVYEPYKFHCKNGIYIPDFYIVQLDCYIEVKPYEQDADPRWMEIGTHAFFYALFGSQFRAGYTAYMIIEPGFIYRNLIWSGEYGSVRLFPSDRVSSESYFVYYALEVASKHAFY